MEFPVLWSVLCNLIWFGGDKCLETLARPSYSRNWRVNKPFIILKHILASQSILVLEKKSLGRLPFLSIDRRQRPVRNFKRISVAAQTLLLKEDQFDQEKLSHFDRRNASYLQKGRSCRQASSDIWEASLVSI